MSMRNKLVKITNRKRHGNPRSSVLLNISFHSLEHFVPSKNSKNWKHTIPSTWQRFFGNNRKCFETSCIFRLVSAACPAIRWLTVIKRFAAVLCDLILITVSDLPVELKKRTWRGPNVSIFIKFPISLYFCNAKTKSRKTLTFNLWRQHVNRTNSASYRA